jgi:hypothetical protein
MRGKRRKERKKLEVNCGNSILDESTTFQSATTISSK